MTYFQRLMSLLVLTLLISCDKVDPFDIENVDFGDPEIGVPLVNSTFYIADLGVNQKNNTDVISDSEGRVTLRYSNEIDPIPIREVFPAEENQKLAVVANPQEFTLPFHAIDIRSAVFKDAHISFDINNPTNETLNITLNIPEISKAGTSFSETYILNSGQNFQSPQIDLSEMNLDSDRSLTISYQASTASNPSVNISDLTINFDRLQFSYLEGIFEDAILPTTEDLIDISFFDSWVSGGLNLSDPKLVFDIENSIGIPAELKLNYANITTIDNQTFQLESDLLNDGVTFDYPSLSQIGESKATSVEINSDNSNVVDLFDKKPSGIEYDLDLTISSGPSQELGFYTDESNITVNAVVELPLYLRANDLILQDTVDFEEITYDNIEGTGELKISLINAFPIGVGVNLDFLNEQGEKLFTLVDPSEWVSVAANTDQALTVADLEPEISSIPISEENIAQLPIASKVLVKVLITTKEGFDDEYVWVYDHHGIDIKLGAVLR